MTDSAEEPKGTLPEGDEDPNLIYTAVGKAIHAWEGMEEALASLYLKMIGIPPIPNNYAAHYGSKYRRFSDRMTALQKAAGAYFVSHTDQEKEGEFSKIVEKIESLAIDRHRIAHGHISMVGEFKLPENREKGNPSK